MSTTKNRFAPFYALLTKMGIPHTDRRDFIMDYTDGLTDSLSDLYHKHTSIYLRMIGDMQRSVATRNEVADVWRKRVFASIGGYLKLVGRESNADIIKAIACRATGFDRFNEIPANRLQNVYNTFLNKQKDFNAMSQELRIDLIQQASLN